MSEDSPVNDVKPNNVVATRRTLRRAIGMVLFSALVASWFVWGPLGLLCYVGGRFNSLWVFVLTFPFVMMAPLVIILLPVLIIRSIIYWGGSRNVPECIRPSRSSH